MDGLMEENIGGQNKMLVFNLKKQWFEKIKSGEKTHEYRKLNDYWENRISNVLDKHNNEHDDEAVVYYKDWVDFIVPMKVKFCCGYPKKDDKEKTLMAIVKEIRVVDGAKTDLKYNGNVFDISFKLIKGE